MNDLLPPHTHHWQYLETKLQTILESYAYQEIRTPLLEATELFSRSIGEVTDIVEKEMFTFIDRNGDNLTLRPEGTASCVRAAIEQGLLHTPGQRLWYKGPMFRHERPQQGRYRQFHQLGAEVYGLKGPDIDAEIIALTARFWKTLGLDNLTLQLNSLGSKVTRDHYRQQLITYFTQHLSQLDEDSQRRLKHNPLRILDSKNPHLQTLIAQAPQFSDYLDDSSHTHFTELTQLLTHLNIPYQVNPRLVRGLDYYNNTVFEWITPDLGAQSTVCAGGRYDGLIEQLGGKPVPAIGFALGMERLLLLLTQQNKLPEFNKLPHIYLILTELTLSSGMHLAETLREILPTLRILTHCGGGNFKTQFKKADKSGARFALILGEDEIAQQQVTLKDLRSSQPQITLNQTELVAYLNPILNQLTT